MTNERDDVQICTTEMPLRELVARRMCSRAESTGDYYWEDYVADADGLIADIREHDAALAAMPSACPACGLRPMETAPKDGQPVLVKIKDDLSPFGVEPDSFGGTDRFQGLFAVMANRGDYAEWYFAAPVGRAGFPDAWLSGWVPLPAAHAPETAAEESK